jgi:N-acetyl-beta-hexosaminidase
MGAWEEINPTTGSVQRHEQRSPSSALEPASREQFAVELTSCLALVAPVGMTEEAKRDWLRVAWETVGHLPSDVLEAACLEARKSCDHPSKIVPAILSASEQRMRWRREAVRDQSDNLRLPKPAYCTPAEAAAILKEYGLR